MAGSDIRYVCDQTYETLAAAEAAVVTSGTATLETALLGIPEVVVYRTLWFQVKLQPYVLNVPWVSLVNLNLGREEVAEIIQSGLVMDEIFIHILTGVFLIVVGLLVKRFPMLIAGYNTMPAEKKKNVDIAGLSSFMRRHLVIIGALWVLLAVVLNLTGQQDALPVVYVIYLPVYVVWMLVRAQRYDHNKQ